jgi:hypothetical protein
MEEKEVEELMKSITQSMHQNSGQTPTRREEKDKNSNRIAIFENKIMSEENSRDKKDTHVNDYKKHLEEIRSLLKKKGLNMEMDPENKLSLIGEAPGLSARYEADWNKGTERISFTIKSKEGFLTELVKKGVIGEEELNVLKELHQKGAVPIEQVKNIGVFNNELSKIVDITPNSIRLKTKFSLEKEIHEARNALSERK